MTSTNHVGRELKAAMARAGVRQYELAVKLGVAPSKISALANGHLKPDEMERLCRAIEVVLDLNHGSLTQQAAAQT